MSTASALGSSVLVLNRNYLAIRVIDVKRAFSLLLRELAEVIHIERGQYSSYAFSEWCELSELARRFEPDAHDWIRTVRFDIAVPRIIRLAIYDRLPKQDVKFNRRNIYARDGNRCQYTGRLLHPDEGSLDHVVPRSRGGADTWENLVWSAKEVNQRKADRLPHEAGLKLLAVPRAPKELPVTAHLRNAHGLAAWKLFLNE